MFFMFFCIYVLKSFSGDCRGLREDNGHEDRSHRCTFHSFRWRRFEQSEETYPTSQETFLPTDESSAFCDLYQKIFKLKYQSEDTNRKYVVKTRRQVPERRHVTASFKRGVSVVKRSVTRTGVREIVKKPVSYKPAPKADKWVKIPLKKPEGSNVAESAPRTNKEESTKIGEEKKPDPPSMEPAPDGHYELSPMLTKIVEDEIQNAMTKVWELRPTTQDAAERAVSNRFRNKAGEALRNTLGLNVTKRLLNVHNALYVKMVFSGKPLRADLVAFLKRYSISAFKRVGERGGTFAAKMRTFQDFDDLCTDKTLKCGHIRVTVTPCYQFMKCPPNLRTRYDSTKDSKTNDVASKPSQAVVSEANKLTEKSTEQNTSQSVALNQIPTKPSQAAIPEANTATKVTPKAQDQQQKVVPKTTPAKVENKATANPANETQNPTKTPVKTPDAQTQDSGKQNVAQTPDPVKQNPVQKPSSVSKETPNKPTNQNASPKVNPKTNNDQAQNSSQKATPAKVTTPQNSIPKVVPKATQSTQNTAKTSPKVATPIKVTTQSQSSVPKVNPKPTQSSQNIATSKPAAPSTLTTPKPATATPKPATATPKPATATPKPATATPKPATATPKPATATPKPATATPKSATATPKPATPSKLATPKPAATSKLGTSNNQKVAAKVATTKATTAKITANNSRVAKNKITKTPKKKQSDFDELSDRDILALISEGIVLDECSGSDVD